MPTGGSSDFENADTGAVTKATAGINDTASSQIKDTLKQMYAGIEKGIMPKQMLDISDGTIEGMYSQAYTLYNQGKFKEAGYLFVVLMLLDPNQPKFHLGSGACLHRMGKYEKAAQVYILCSTLDPKNPLPHFHAADCYIKLQALPLADMCLKNAIQCCGENKEYELIKERSLLMQGALAEEMKNMEAEAAASETAQDPQE